MSQAAKTAVKKPPIPLSECPACTEILAQMDAAADAALNHGLTPMRAKEMFLYSFLQRAVERYGTQNKAAIKLGTTRQYINDSLQKLEVRLAH